MKIYCVCVYVCVHVYVCMWVHVHVCAFTCMSMHAHVVCEQNLTIQFCFMLLHTLSTTADLRGAK